MNRQTLTSACSILSFIMIVGILGTESFAEEKLDLKFRPKPGQKYAVRITTQDKISQTVMGQQQNINHTKTTGLGFEVKEVDTNGITLIKITYRNLKEKTDSTAGQFEYDSTDPCTAIGNPLAPTYATLMGQSFTIKVSPKGQIIEIIGLDEMFSRMAEKIVKADDEMLSKAPTTACEKKEDSKSTAAGKAQEKESAEERAKRRIDSINKQYGSKEKRIEAVKEMVKKMPMFGEDQIKNMLSDMIMAFPDRPVGIGDSWTAKMISASQSLPIEIDGTYTVKGSKKGVVIVDISSKRDLDDEAVPIGKVHMKIAGSYQGTSEINEASGWMMRSKTNMRFSGEMKIAASEEMPQAIPMPISIETQTVVEPIE